MKKPQVSKKQESINDRTIFVGFSESPNFIELWVQAKSPKEFKREIKSIVTIQLEVVNIWILA